MSKLILPRTFRHPSTKKTDTVSHIVREPAEGKRSPLIVSCPHAGLYIPEGFEERLATDPLTFIRRGDIYTDWLSKNAPQYGAAHIISTAAAAYLNIGRAIDSIHPDDLLNPGDLQTNPNDKYVKNGLQQGLIALRTLYNNETIYKNGQEPDAKEIQYRIDQHYLPFHNGLETLVDKALKQHQRALVLDIHSCPSTGTEADIDTGQTRPDIIISNADGKSCNPGLIDLMSAVTKEFGLSIYHNDPYSGGFITQKYGAHSTKAQGSRQNDFDIQSVQIEFSRKSFGMDENTLEIEDGKAFIKMQNFATTLISRLSEYTQDNQHYRPA